MFLYSSVSFPFVVWFSAKGYKCRWQRWEFFLFGSCTSTIQSWSHRPEAKCYIYIYYRGSQPERPNEYSLLQGHCLKCWLQEHLAFMFRQGLLCAFSNDIKVTSIARQTLRFEQWATRRSTCTVCSAISLHEMHDEHGIKKVLNLAYSRVFTGLNLNT